MAAGRAACLRISGPSCRVSTLVACLPAAGQPWLLCLCCQSVVVGSHRPAPWCAVSRGRRRSARAPAAARSGRRGSAAHLSQGAPRPLGAHCRPASSRAARAASAAAIRLLLRDEPRRAAERATLAARRSQFRGFARADLPAGPGAAADGEGGVSPRLRRAVRLLLLRGRWRQAGRQAQGK